MHFSGVMSNIMSAGHRWQPTLLYVKTEPPGISYHPATEHAQAHISIQAPTLPLPGGIEGALPAWSQPDHTASALTQALGVQAGVLFLVPLPDYYQDARLMASFAPSPAAALSMALGAPSCITSGHFLQSGAAGKKAAPQQSPLSMGEAAPQAFMNSGCVGSAASAPSQLQCTDLEHRLLRRIAANSMAPPGHAARAASCGQHPKPRGEQCCRQAPHVTGAGRSIAFQSKGKEGTGAAHTGKQHSMQYYSPHLQKLYS